MPPDVASESPSGVNARRKKNSTAAKKAAETRSRRRHCRAGVRFDDERFRCPMKSIVTDSRSDHMGIDIDTKYLSVYIYI